MKRVSIIISAVFAVCMVIALLPSAAFAEGEEADAAADVTAATEFGAETNKGINTEIDTVAEAAETEEAEQLQTGLRFIDGNWFYFDAAGVMQTGVVTIGSARYYFQPDSNPAGAMWTTAGWKDFDGIRYYFVRQADGTARMHLGWLTIDTNKWYCDPDTGAVVIGWKTISNKTYYFLNTVSEPGRMATGLKTIDGTRYFFSTKGVMKTGAVKYNGKLYYFRSNGKAIMKVKWFKGSDGKKRYSLGNGRVAAGTKKIKGIWYKFSTSTGILLLRIGDGVDKKIQSYTSKTKYMIIVKLSEHKVRIYKGRKNNWKRIHTFKCTTGAHSSPTVRGTFTVGAKGRYFNTGSAQRCWYYTQFHGNYLFHSVVYDRSSTPRHVVDGRLGISASHGCVRLALGNAKWIYSNIPRGTKVVTY